MEIILAHFEVKNTTVTREVAFPLYRWWDARKERIIKMYPEYYEHAPELMKRIIIIKIDFGWNTDARIVKEHVLVHANIIENSIQAYFNDYTLKATEAEFLEFRDKAIKDLI
jgi:hypothetical protein